MLWCQKVMLSIVLVFIFYCDNVMSSNESDNMLNEVDTGNRSESTAKISNSGPSEHQSLTAESRGWKKSALPFLLGITLKMTTLLPMISSLMTIIGGVALIASKLALVLSVGLAVHYYMMTKQQISTFYRQPLAHYDPVLPVTPYPMTHRLSVQST